MPRSEVENRLARIRGAQPTVVAPPTLHMPPEPIWAEAANRSIRSELIAIPIALLVGVATPILAAMITFHFASDSGVYGATANALLTAILGDIGLEIVLSGIVIVVLLIKNWWLPLLANAVGGFIGMWHAHVLMQQFPGLFAHLFSPSYVQDMLFHAAQNPHYF